MSTRHKGNESPEVPNSPSARSGPLGLDSPFELRRVPKRQSPAGGTEFETHRFESRMEPGSAPVNTDRHASIWESELCRMVAEAVYRGGLETGGEAFGTYTRAGRMCILYATGPGEDALHTSCHFRQDLDQFHRNQTLLWHDWGLQLLGNYHSHHTLGLEAPSSDDATNTTNLANRGHLKEILQLVVTYEYLR